MKKYDHKKIEKKWQGEWERSHIYKTGAPAAKKPKFYILDMFPYPSGEGLHVGHPKGYIATDIVSRMKRMQGYNVLHPMGFDAFGLPAENYALKTKTNPRIAVAKNVKRYKKQLEIIGFDYDWSREVNTTDPKYYKWTQWIFLKLLEKGLAYESYEPINWCPSCKTGLANEDVVDGRCERCNTPVEKKPMRQWVLRITKYADRLLEDLDAKESDVPLIKRTIGSDKVRADLPFQERHAIVSIVKHWSEDKYLCSRYKKNDWQGFITGGVEEGEDIGKTAVREVAEESGYESARFVRTFGRVDSQFYHEVKNVNRFAHFTGVYLELADGKRNEPAEEEKALADVVWLSKEEVGKFLNREDMKYLWDLFTGKKKQEGEKPLLEWPESIKEAQRNWIGRSEGAEINFSLKVGGKERSEKLTVFTTRPDTLFGVTYVVVAPEHAFVTELLKHKENLKNHDDVVKYVASARVMTEIERTDAKKDKTGVKLEGVAAVNPANGEEVPVYVADYVLADYGTGAVMAVPAHDERDYAFAKRFGLKIVEVVLGGDVSKEAYIGSGKLANSGEFSGSDSESSKKAITKSVGGEWVVKYKLKDWVFSRQRYWGEPIPVLHDGTAVIPVSEKDLPVELPNVKSYEPTGTGESPLAGIAKWVNVKVGRGKDAKIVKRETNTMPQWAGSSWYYLRFMDPKNPKKLVDPKAEKYWNQVDFYVGGAEHATRHLIYARFWHKFLYDIGAISTKEPFKKLQSVGLIMGEDGRKMSKRFGNVVNPDDIVSVYGADTLRVYEMFMGPFDQAIAWSTSGIVGSRRFLERVWNMREKVASNETEEASFPKQADVLLNKTIKKVSEDMAALRHNTAVSSLMILSNEFEKAPSVPRAAYEALLKLLAPLAPHMAEELWRSLGNKKSIHVSTWPKADESKLVEESVTIVVQVNGKVRGSFEASKNAAKDDLEKAALGLDEVKKWTEGKEIRKIIVVPGKLVSIVVS
ncbi:MAG TPA: leucine--tRNA ligase [Candidatus Paceibacterota bacterium]|nr:leucine--tRNA ligase [Candidatus Paceibacterota bacterium]